MKKLLIVSNLPSNNTKILLDQVKKGAESIGSENIKIISSDAINITYNSILESSAIILGTTENLGYMSGIIKDFFDRNYNQCLNKTNGLPYALYIRAGHDGTGTELNIKKIITGLKWKEIQKPLILKGVWNNKFKDQCFNLGATVAAGIDANIY
ncbi:MAG: flavodoxin family protein [Hyphomicrobiales bacterium]|jgi:multimeric flavodoxin WrbA|nr:flavodoxin family protein [Hyphomicrobiales bacterium]|tara:strand:+ start:265 stop:726 length:462 start_codon:yes stop_codon:yes gene_type:complete